jgi:carbamoyltransferase
MGLAAYGDPAVFREQVAVMLDTSVFPYRYRNPPSPSLLGIPLRTDGTALTPPYPDLAAAVQEALETAVARVVGSVAKPGEPLCLGGGVALNCAANGSLLRAKLAARISIFPAAGDAGLPVGAALLASREVGDTVTGQLTPYLGPAFSPERCETALRQAGLAFCHFEDIAAATAERLAAGKVVGWFQGRMEIGPRALGNRSILASPCTTAIRDRVNGLKGREPWRPLAPAVIARQARDFFELSQESPCMLFAARVRPEQRERIAAVVHVDGTSRPQTVAPEQNQRLHELLTAFARHRGVPVLLNSSFNQAGEPIVCSPEDAIRTYRATGLDALVLGNFLVEKPEGAEPNQAEREAAVD